MTHRALITQMLDVLIQHPTDDGYKDQRWEAILAARKYLAAPEQEPALEVVAEPDHWHNGHFYEDTGRSYISETAIRKLPIGTKLYTHTAPKAEPVNQQLLEALGEMVERFEPNAWGSNENRMYALTNARAAIAAAEDVK